MYPAYCQTDTKIRQKIAPWVVDSSDGTVAPVTPEAIETKARLKMNFHT